MKKSLVTVLVVLVALGLTKSTMAATTPSLGLAASYGVLAGTYTNPAVTSTIYGDVGFTTPPANIPLPLGLHPSVTYPNYGDTANATPQARIDAANALSVGLAPQPCTWTGIGVTDLGADTTHNGGGTPGLYEPGVYCTDGAVTAANITLSGAGTYIFRIAGVLGTTATDSITLTNGASACNVFWTPTSATTLAANTNFIGTIIDNANAITLNDSVNRTGRALSLGAGTVTTTSNDIITVPTCTAPVATGGSARVPRLIPLISVLKVPTPLFLPFNSGLITYNYTLQNVGPNPSLINIRMSDDKCAPLVLISGDNNHDGNLDQGEKRMYTCTARLSITTTNIVTAYAESNDSYRDVAIDTATATVVVGTGIIPLPTPLINIIKIPSRLIPFPIGGGDVKYTYIVSNPGVVVMHDIVTTDNKCSPLALISGDINHDHFLDLNEKWVYTCQTHISTSTTNTATTKGEANGFTVYDYAFANVLVSTLTHPAADVVPMLPKTGLPIETEGKSNLWSMILFASLFVMISTSLVVVLRKHKA